MICGVSLDCFCKQKQPLSKYTKFYCCGVVDVENDDKIIRLRHGREIDMFQSSSEKEPSVDEALEVSESFTYDKNVSLYF